MAGRLAWCVLLSVAGLTAQELTVVSGASFQPGIAPESLATAFGSAMAAETLPAELEDGGTLPTELGGVTVEVNGERAGLLFVSPGQVNFLVPRDVRTGVASVVVTNRNTVRSLRGDAVIRLVAPGIFRAGDAGAIVNAVTWRPGPFRVETPETPGADRRTRLAVFATGLRWAGNPNRESGRENVAARVRATLQRGDGRTQTLTAEYAGPAAGFFGLDQVNVLLPPEASGFGAAALVLSVDGAASNEAPLVVEAMPVDAVRVRGLELAPSASGGEVLRATVLLNAPAPEGGLAVTPDSTDRTVANVPNLVVVPAGQTQAGFDVRTERVTTARDVRVTAQGGGGQGVAEVRVRPAGAPTLASLDLNPAVLAAGGSARATVTLSSPADTSPVTIALAATPSRVQIPAGVEIPFGRSSASVDLVVPAGATPGTVAIAATYEGQTRQSGLEIRAPLGLELSAETVTGGRSVTGRIVLPQAAPATGTRVALNSSSPLAARVPTAVTVPSGSSTTTFTIETTAPNTDERVTVTAQAGAATASAQLVIEADSFGIESFTISPAGVSGGSSAEGTVLIRTSTPVLGLITIFSSNMALARAPLALLAPRGQSRVQFRIQTTPLPVSDVVEFTATFFGVSRTARLRVN